MILTMPVMALMCLAVDAPEPKVETKNYRLVAARVSERRGQNVIIKLAPTDGMGKEMILQFPAHSFTENERKLIKAVREAVKFGSDNSRHEWTTATRNLQFTLPVGVEKARLPGWTLWEKVQLTPPEPK